MIPMISNDLTVYPLSRACHKEYCYDLVRSDLFHTEACKAAVSLSASVYRSFCIYIAFKTSRTRGTEKQFHIIHMAPAYTF